MTTEQFIVTNIGKPIGHPGDYLLPTELVMTLMREFAKLHVQAALQAASEKVQIRVTGADCEGEVDYVAAKEEYIISDCEGGLQATQYVEPYKESILNAYPLENIK